MDAADSRRASAREAWDRFGRWRRRRPFWGGSLLVVAALLIGYLPAEYGRFLLFATGSFTGTALLFASLILGCGLLSLAVPRLASLLGLLGMLLSTVALLGALGGFVVGTVVGGVGGLLCFAWTPPEDAVGTDAGPGDDTEGRVGRFSWEQE
ncbi:MAG: DUF6114 domain-containing protein [Haloarculaceae archaeon]